MSYYLITGGKKLEGTVKISGSKNASLPILAATILNGDTSILYNVPDIHDTKITLEILKEIGCKVEKKKNKIVINSSMINKFDIPETLMRQMRSSVVLAGALIGRFKKAKFSYPGGCDIGSRPIDLQIKGLSKLGIEITEELGYINCQSQKIVGNLIDLDFPSVGATENIILASIFAKGETVISNAAREPEIIDLQNFLNKMGAKISGAGTSSIIIKGVEKLNKVSYNIMADRIETGTYMCMAAITNGNIILENTTPEYITPVINKLEECGAQIEVYKNKILIKNNKRLKAINIKTMPYPGFPTDMQSVFGGMLATAKGTSIISENIFENRYRYINELRRMGAKAVIEGKTAIIKGTKKIYGTNVLSTDLRGGAAMCTLALVAKGITKIEKIEYIQRGYEKFEEKLQKLGANIKYMQ